MDNKEPEKIKEENSLVKMEEKSEVILSPERNFEQEGFYEKFNDFLSTVFTGSIEKTIETVNSRAVRENVAIFVDYDNVFWTLMKKYVHHPDHEDPQKNLFVKLWERYGHNHVRTFRAYADFEKVKTNLTSLQKKRIQIRHVYSNDKDGDRRKNSSDIEMCIDIIESTYKDPNIKCYVIVTADSDMIPIMSRLRYKGKRVELFYLSTAAPKHIDMTTFADYHQDLLEFLNVEIKDYNVDDYIDNALMFIDQWWVWNERTDNFLSSQWLVERLWERLSIPIDVVSSLIEKLRNEELIHEVKKNSRGQLKQSIALTSSGRERIEKIKKEVAAGKQTQ